MQAIYGELMERMAEGYAVSRLAIVNDYQSWTCYNTAQSLSATHGSRFVNSYANEVGAAYGTLGEGETLHAGSVLAITEDGRRLPGALFVMEKLAAGTSPRTADWCYVVVNSDGSLFGNTTSDEADLVGYCHTCHSQTAARDYTFFALEECRVNR